MPSDVTDRRAASDDKLTLLANSNAIFRTPMKQSKKTKWHYAGLKAAETKRLLAEKRGYKWAKPWRDTHTPAAGAEYYVVAQLMFRDIDAFKCERGRAGVDVVAADAKRGTSVGIQVKSRYYSNATGFPIKEPKADFVVFARLNLDSSTARDGERAPECFVFPAAVVRRVIEVGSSGQWPRCHINKIRDVEKYREAWALIDKALKPRRISAVRKATHSRSKKR
jgi:hypothetical protein